jgi:hypothetical protein
VDNGHKIGVEEKHKFAVDLVVDRQGTSINGFPMLCCQTMVDILWKNHLI